MADSRPALADPVVIVGGSLGGLRVAEQLRAQGYEGPVVVAGAESHLPYSRPPLSKSTLLTTEPDLATWHATTAFRQRPSVADVDWMLGRSAVETDLDRRRVVFDDGTALQYSALVVATGLRPRRLRGLAAGDYRHVIRTLEDSLRLRSALVPGARVVVVGGGFIGCELASTAAGLGCAVTVIEPMAEPMVRVLGAELGAAIRRFHEVAGVEFVVGAGVTSVEEVDAARALVHLTDGRKLPADAIVEAIGSHPNVEWLAGNGLDLSDGVLCDAQMRVEGRADVVAVGDVARFPNPRYDGQPRRVEHWSIPTDTAKAAARSLAAHLRGAVRAVDGRVPPFAPLPSFWSDQGKLRIQAYGAPGLGDEIEIARGSTDDLLAGVLIHYRQAGQLVGVVGINVLPAQQRELRELANAAYQTLAEGAS